MPRGVVIRVVFDLGSKGSAVSLPQATAALRGGFARATLSPV
jgi:hypothetical protein